MNFKIECLSSLLVTINTEMIIFNIRLSIVTKLNHEIQEKWYLAPMLVYDSFIHELSPRSLWFQNTNWYKKFRLLAMILALICFLSLSRTGKKVWGGGPQQRGAERGWVMRFWALCKGWVVQFSATLRGWVTLFYYIDRH